MPSVSLGIIAGTGLAGSLISGNAAQSAAQTQANAANQATAVQQQEFAQTEANLAPFIGAGPNALKALQTGTGTGPGGTGTGPLNAPFNPADLQNTPGYKFQMDQGMEAILNSRTATGGVGGGNTLKAINEFGQNLAGTTYQQALTDYLTQNQQAFQQLYDITSLGENAAAGQGQIGANVASSIGSNIVGAANASAAGTVGAANAFSSGLSGITSNYLLAQALGGGGGGGWGSILSSPNAPLF